MAAPTPHDAPAVPPLALSQSGEAPAPKRRLQVAATHRNLRILAPADLEAQPRSLPHRTILSAVLAPQLHVPVALLTAIKADAPEMKDLLNSLATLFESQYGMEPLLEWAIGWELDEKRASLTASNAAATLFRGTTVATKLVSQFMALHGKSILRETVTPVLNALLSMPFSPEADPARIQGATQQTLAAHVTALTDLCTDIMSRLTNLLPNFPFALRRFFCFLRNAVEAKFPSSGLTIVGGFFFLRFINPNLSAPETDEASLTPRALSPAERRSLVLVCKILQNLSNGVEFGDKEAFMAPFNPYLAAMRVTMTNFLSTISTVAPDEGVPVALGVRTATVADKKAAIASLAALIEVHWDGVELRMEPTEAAALLAAVKTVRRADASHGSPVKRRENSVITGGEENADSPSPTKRRRSEGQALTPHLKNIRLASPAPEKSERPEKRFALEEREPLPSPSKRDTLTRVGSELRSMAEKGKNLITSSPRRLSMAATERRASTLSTRKSKLGL